MKTHLRRCLAAAIVLSSVEFLQGAPGVVSQPTPVQIIDVPPPTSYAITVQDGNSRVWKRTTYEQSPSGQVITNVHSYTELASGLNHLVNGQWMESKEEIDIQPNGTAAATNGQHQAYFPGDIYEGQIELVTSDGKNLKSRPMALSYFDGTNTVLIAELTNSIGVVAGNNQVIYPDTFTGFKADLRYTYTKAGFEQDIILKEQPPTPESLGLNPDTARLQVFTEFFAPPQPAIQSAVMPKQAGVSLTDQSLGFGQMQMIPGRAFLLGENATDSGARVGKQWVQVEGRQFLVEEVPVDAIAEGLATLPLPTQIGSSTTPHIVSKHLTLPPQRLMQNISKKMLTKASLPASGFVLDYVTLNTSKNNFTFQGDTTYFISGHLNLFSGTTTIEGGAVLKYTNSASINFPAGGLVSKAGPYRMAVLTSMNDNSVGETIANSTGNPMPDTNVMYAYLSLTIITASNPPLSYLRFAYAGTALAQPSAGTDDTGIFAVWNCQFVNCGTAIMVGDTYAENTVNQKLYNVLFANCGSAVYNGATYYGGDIALSGQNVTADNVTNFLWTWGGDTYAASSTLTNSILTGVTYQIHYVYSSGYNFGGNFSTYDCYGSSTSSGVYQTAGAGSYYLADNTHRNAGTTNINSTLLAQLRQKTTYPPIIYSNVTISANTTLSPQAQRDTDTPDLGYHYDPLDYVIGNSSVSNASLTVMPGTAIGVFAYGNFLGHPAIEPDGTAQLNFNGLVNGLIHVISYNAVQEQSNTNWVGFGPIIAPPQSGDSTATADFDFTEWDSMAGQIYDFFDQYGNRGPVFFQNCEFHNGLIDNESDDMAFTNCLFIREGITANQDDLGIGFNFSMQNCLVWNGSMFVFYDMGGNFTFQNNLFDRPAIDVAVGDGINDHNGYVTNCDRLIPNATNDVILLASPAYQSSWLGNYYQPTNSPLIDAGSTNANLIGLYHFTTQTNQVPETNSIVDIGYHYVATDASGNPLDTDGDGVPDYIEDANGNGMVDGSESSWTNYNSANGLSGGNGLMVFTPLK